MRMVKAPKPWSACLSEQSVFLGGSIEMGQAEDWQTRLTEMLADTSLLVLNPRRDDWDSSWKQVADNLQFREQVEWELAAQEHADYLVYYFSPGTKSPITLLEFGLFSRRKGTIVCCPDGFWRKGNVDIACERYGVWQVHTLDAIADRIRSYVWSSK